MKADVLAYFALLGFVAGVAFGMTVSEIIDAIFPKEEKKK